MAGETIPVTPFAVELQKAMDARGLRQVDVIRLGFGRSTLANVRRGSIPSQDVAVRLSEVLYWPNLARLAALARTGSCALCGATFVKDAHAPNKAYCKPGCARAAHARRMRDRSRTNTLTETRLTRKRLDDIRAAVAAFCGTCTAGEQVCRTEDCELRAVSPLPFVPLSKSSNRRVA